MSTPLFFIWNGQDSLHDYGLYIKSFPDRIRPAERVKTVNIPGRSGSLTMLEGDDIYSAFSAEMVVLCKNKIQMEQAAKWLRGSGTFALADDIDRVRQARIANEVKFNTVGSNLFSGTIPFVFQPFRVSRFPENTDRITFSSASKTITNLGDVASRPKVTITGTGNNTITFGTQAMTFTGISGTIVVDCDAEIITSGNTVWTGSTGNYWKIPKGSLTITQTGSMTIVVDPCWRWL